MKQLLVQQLKDLYDGEHQLLEALPTMSKQATNKRLAETLEEHYEETRMHVTRLEEAFEHLSEKPQRKTCPAMKGLLAEAREGMNNAGNNPIRDFSIVAQGLRIEHYEKAGYFLAAHLADSLDYDEVHELLAETLAEEEDAAQELEGFVNPSFFDSIRDSLGTADKRQIHA